MYKLKPEYMTQTYAVATADHNNYCKTFERLLQSETIRMHNSKGVVVLFAGLSPDDKAELEEEVDRFVSQDPLIEQGIVETWNILDLDPNVVEGGPGASLDGIIEERDTSNDDTSAEGDGSGEEQRGGGGDDDDEDDDDDSGEGEEDSLANTESRDDDDILG
eukprot:Colp12_sorted_trinity150504_noHs@3120